MYLLAINQQMLIQPPLWGHRCVPNTVPSLQGGICFPLYTTHVTGNVV